MIFLDSCLYSSTFRCHTLTIFMPVKFLKLRQEVEQYWRLCEPTKLRGERNQTLLPSTHTGANRLSLKRPRKQRRGGGEVDLQIKLLSLCPLKGPAVTSAFVRGRRNDQANDLASLLGRTLLQRKRDREEEKEAFPRTCSLLCLSQCRIYPNQHTCQPDSYKRFPTLL